MPFDSGNISFNVYKVLEDLPEDHLEKFSTLAACLPEKVSDTPNLGWVARHLLERRIDPDTAYVGDFLHLHFRSAVRKIPKSLMHAECMQRELALMEAEKISSISRKKKKEIKEEVEEQLLKYMPPQFTGVPIVYDSQESTLYIGSSSVKQSDNLIKLFIETTGCEAVPMTPVGEAMRALETNTVQFDPIDFAGTQLNAADELMLGRDFLTWIWYKVEADSAKFTVPDLGEFTVGIDGPLVLVSENIGSHESVLRKGLPTLSPEAHQAIRSGKKLRSARVSLVRGDEIWIFTLDADFFMFKSVKLPDGEAMDKIARFEERIESLNVMQQAFYSLYHEFIKSLSGKDRKAIEEDIHDWSKNRLYHNPENHSE
ncbi:MAG: recombination-associated protein RdgC [Lentisphaeraceae bacterium]|nr:recombination-associated protein RdgC [Lentisphaeraceae bacterium]